MKDNDIALPMLGLVEQTRELEEQMEETTHHNFVAVLKEVSACLPLEYQACTNQYLDRMHSSSVRLSSDSRHLCEFSEECLQQERVHRETERKWSG